MHLRATERPGRPALLVALALLAGCARVGPPVPPPAAPAEWPVDAGSVATVPAGGPWWTGFDDPALDFVVARIAAENGDLAAAGFRLRSAELAARLAGRALLPSASASIDGSGLAALDSGYRSRNSGASAAVSWEVDLFGRLAAARDAQAWAAAATAEDLAATRLSIIGTGVLLWFELAHVNERIAIGEQSILYARRALDLVRIQYGAGAVSRVGLRDAEQVVATQEAAQVQLVQNRTALLNSLGALLSGGQYQGPEPARLPDGALPAVDVGQPVSLLGRRPDLAAAEHRLRALLANARATAASFYPTITIDGAVTTSSSTGLAGFFDNPAATFSALGALPLNLGRQRLAVGAARADYDAAAAAFRQTFGRALADVATGLAARQRLENAQTALDRALSAARESEQLYERQYRAGAIPLRQWLDAQERRRLAEAAAIDNRLARVSNQVALVQALGGDRRPGG
jgi:NodT family efflux transporter outer membrane factor (OMF) lipoprotein